jgi:hypothetical protein
MLDEQIRPSAEADAVLRKAGWAPDHSVEISDWVARLREDGNEVFPAAEAIMRHFGGIHLDHREAGGPSEHDFDVNPTHWYDERDRVEGIEDITRARVCPLGETSGAAMLAVLDDGRIVADLDGWILQIARTWREALDHFILGRGDLLLLAEDYDKPVEPRPWHP